jgi:hypothetical protein
MPMYYDTSLKTSRVDRSTLFSPRCLSRNGNFFFPSQKTFFGKKDLEEMDGSDGTRKDTDTEDTTIVQIEEVERAIRVLTFVTKLSPVGAVTTCDYADQLQRVACRWFHNQGSDSKCFLQHLRQLLGCTREERDCEVLRVWVLKGLFCQWMMTLNSGHDVSE